MKKQIARICWILVMLCMLLPTAFAISDEGYASAEVLHSLGLFNGTGTGANGDPIYDLERAPTRQEAVTMLVRILGKEEEAQSGSWDMPFHDVADWAKPYIGYAYANGLTSGTGASTFDGSAPVTASQYITLLLRALGYSSSTDFKWDAAWELSDTLGLTSGEYSAETTTFLRGDVVKLSCAALNTRLKEEDTLLIARLAADGAVDEAAAAAQGFDIYGLTDHVHLIYDIRTFTLYAFMNYTGYDDNNDRPITGTRAALRGDLAAMDINISSPDYYTKKGLASRYYASALRHLGAAPDFQYCCRDEIKPALSDLPQKLSEFYTAADIPFLYEKYRADHEKALYQYKRAFPDVVKMACYFRVQNEVESEFGLEVVLLDAWNRGSGLNTVDQNYGFGVIRTGPADEVNVLNILHEYAHGFVNHILDGNKAQVSALSGFFERDCPAAEQGYDTWSSITQESFVRAISTYFDSSLTQEEKEQIVDEKTEDGFVMTRYVYDRIPEFETFSGDFNAFVKMLLEEYPQYA